MVFYGWHSHGGLRDNGKLLELSECEPKTQVAVYLEFIIVQMCMMPAVIVIGSSNYQSKSGSFWTKFAFCFGIRIIPLLDCQSTLLHVFNSSLRWRQLYVMRCLPVSVLDMLHYYLKQQDTCQTCWTLQNQMRSDNKLECCICTWQKRLEHWTSTHDTLENPSGSWRRCPLVLRPILLWTELFCHLYLTAPVHGYWSTQFDRNPVNKNPMNRIPVKQFVMAVQMSNQGFFWKVIGYGGRCGPRFW